MVVMVLCLVIFMGLVINCIRLSCVVFGLFLSGGVDEVLVVISLGGMVSVLWYVGCVGCRLV